MFATLKGPFTFLACWLCVVALLAKGERQNDTFESFEEYEYAFHGRDLEAATVPPSSIKWPQFVPRGKYYFDTKCFGHFQKYCKKEKLCKWYTESDPTCYDTRFVSVTIPPVQIPNKEKIPLHVKFFQFNFGVHLVEGTFIKRFYGLTVDECADRCLRSAGGSMAEPIRDKLRCMSFDYYPFETWIAGPPYYESEDRGICVLNNETKDSARLRNEDQGLTDAELFYKSHCSRRPFSEKDGYYEVRDPRGALTPLLEYAGPSSLGLEAPWGGSRWGMFHPNKPGYVPQPLTQVLNCKIASGEEPPPPTFRGGYTPVSDEQKCPGLVTKEEARQLCARTGGELCKNQTDLNLISGRKLGCSFDQSGNGRIWHEEIPDKNQKMYPRCCSTYYLPLSNIIGGKGVCEPYETLNIKFCGQFKTVTECLYSKRPDDKDSNVRESWRKGFGHGLDDIRAECDRLTQDIPGFNCSGMDLGPWATKTNCIWCPEAGLDPIGGSGQCRPGGSYGICPTASEEQKTIFGLRTRSACADRINCDLIVNFPDIAPYMGNYTFDSSGIGGTDVLVTTSKPTPKPTKKKAKGKTPYPTRPTKKPTSSSPTLGPTSSPTNQPTSPTKAPIPTKKPTPFPTKKPTKTPTNKPTKKS